jgi:hypothetical protein
MKVPMRSDFMSRLVDLADDVRVSLGKLAQNKERRSGLMLLEELEKAADVLLLTAAEPLPSIDVPIDEALIPVFDVE